MWGLIDSVEHPAQGPCSVVREGRTSIGPLKRTQKMVVYVGLYAKLMRRVALNDASGAIHDGEHYSLDEGR